MKWHKSQVLVLNRQWRPVGVIGVKRALTLMVATYEDGKSKARGADGYCLLEWHEWIKLEPGEHFVRTPNMTIKVPKIIVLSRCDRLPTLQRANLTRNNLFLRDEHTCQYCGNNPGRGQLSIDHVVPKSKGGETSWENCITCCINCNRRKGSKTLERAGMILRKKPVRPPFGVPLTEVHFESWREFLVPN